MAYIDGFVAPVPTANREVYKQHAEQATSYFRKFGALRMVECWGDDVPDGEVTSFPMAVKKTEDETVVFAWIVWPSKEVRDAGMAQMMNDAEMHKKMGEMPFDGKRMIFGGFEVLLDIDLTAGD